MSEQMSLDTRHRDDGGNYIADDDTFPSTVWFANGRKVSIEHTEVKNEIKGGDAYLQIERELHPAFAEMQPDIRDHKYLNAECGLSGCQWLMAQHQVDVYREQMAAAEAKLKILLAAGRTLLLVSLPPHDVSGSEMFNNAAAKFREGV